MTKALETFHIRPAVRADADGFIQLVLELAAFEKLTPPDVLAQARLIEDAFGDSPRIEVWLAFMEHDKEPVGYAIFLETYSSFLARPTFYIEDVFVRETFRRQGIGRALLDKAVVLAAQRRCGRVEWTALDWNVNAQKVYEEKYHAQHLKEWFLYRMNETQITDHLNHRMTNNDE
ncbi:MAG: GNAT family N-acetyltransferase [Pirellulales bacterium]